LRFVFAHCGSRTMRGGVVLVKVYLIRWQLVHWREAKPNQGTAEVAPFGKKSTCGRGSRRAAGNCSHSSIVRVPLKPCSCRNSSSCCLISRRVTLRRVTLRYSLSNAVDPLPTRARVRVVGRLPIDEARSGKAVPPLSAPRPAQVLSRGGRPRCRRSGRIRRVLAGGTACEKPSSIGDGQLPCRRIDRWLHR
jgi:hypothetical protein